MGAMVAGDDDDLIDDDILEIFVEEATEVLESLDEQFPLWRADPDNVEVRKEVRRSFHTLKGSGRMVKASFISELAWAVESVLNRINDGAISWSEPLFDLIERVREVMPALIEAFRDRVTPSLDTSLLILQAEAIGRGEDPAAVVAAAPEPVVAKPEPVAAEPVPVAPDELSEEEMQQINARLDALVAQIEALQGGLAKMQSGLDALQKAPQVKPEDLRTLSQGVELAQGEIQAMKLQARNTADRLEQESQQLRSAMASLQPSGNPVEELRRDMEGQLSHLRSRIEQPARSGDGQTTRLLALLALAVAGMALWLR